MTDLDDRIEEENADPGESSLDELADSIRRRRGDGEPPSGEDGPSLADLAASIRNRGNDGDAADADGSSFSWVGGEEASPAPSEGELDAIVEDSSVLVLGPLARGAGDGPCIDLLTPTGRAVDNVLLVTVTQPADDRLEMWREHADTVPESMKIVTVGDQLRSTDEAANSIGEGSDTISIDNVPDPSDLARLGITLTRTLSEWEGSHTRVCLHSLTALLQYVEPQHLFRFLHVLRGKCDSLDAAAHYHMDPEAHENQTVRLFTSLFETTVLVEGDGSVEIVSGE